MTMRSAAGLDPSLPGPQIDDGRFEPLLNTLQAAALLQVHPKTLQAMVRRREVPAIRVGRLWRFRKSILDRWITSKLTCENHPCRE